MADRQTDDFKLGNKAADMWLYTADACANEKVIPKKYRYTTGTALMNGAEAICSCIEGANLIDLRERPAAAAGDAAGGPLRVQEAGAEDTADGRKQAIPRRERPKGRDLEQGGDDGALYVRRLVREGPEPRCPGERGCSAAIAAFHWGIACSRRQLGPALPELE